MTLMGRELIPIVLAIGTQLLMAGATKAHDPQVTTHHIASKAMNQERGFQVYLPASYDRESRSYPVLYILDGQQYFYNGVACEKSFTHFDRAPEFMVVGIENYHPQRLVSFSESHFLDFLEHELIPYIENTIDPMATVRFLAGSPLASL